MALSMQKAKPWTSIQIVLTSPVRENLKGTVVFVDKITNALTPQLVPYFSRFGVRIISITPQVSDIDDYERNYQRSLPEKLAQAKPSGLKRVQPVRLNNAHHFSPRYIAR